MTNQNTKPIHRFINLTNSQSLQTYNLQRMLLIILLTNNQNRMLQVD